MIKSRNLGWSFASAFAAYGVVLCVLTSCSTVGAHQAFTYRKTLSNSNPSRVFTYSYDPADTTHTYFKYAYANPGAEGQKRVRNRTLYELLVW